MGSEMCIRDSACACTGDASLPLQPTDFIHPRQDLIGRHEVRVFAFSGRSRKQHRFHFVHDVGWHEHRTNANTPEIRSQAVFSCSRRVMGTTSDTISRTAPHVGQDGNSCSSFRGPTKAPPKAPSATPIGCLLAPPSIKPTASQPSFPRKRALRLCFAPQFLFVHFPFIVLPPPAPASRCTPTSQRWIADRGGPWFV